jgi:tRNA(Ile2) C34 agmatinyltransferase TiaS
MENKREYVEIDGKKYVIIKCPHCGTDLRFALEPKGRRVYFQCKTCKKSMDITVE